MKEAEIIIIAGPNGAGKTTFAQNYEPIVGGLTFINADIIAAGLTRMSLDAANALAARESLRLIQELVESGESFATETTLSGKGWARKIPAWREAGYTVGLIYLRLSDVQMSVRRVENRIEQGGHSVPREAILRRFQRSLGNFEKLKDIVNWWALYDTDNDFHQLVDCGGTDG